MESRLQPVGCRETQRLQNSPYTSQSPRRPPAEAGTPYRQPNTLAPKPLHGYVLPADEQMQGLKRLIGVRTKTNRKKTSPALAKGQLWKMDHTHIQIVDLGKMLVHYKMLRDLGQMRRTQMSRIESMEDYLKTNEAQLVKAKKPRRSLKPVSLPSSRRSGLRKGR